MSIDARQLQNLQTGVKAVDDKRAMVPLNQALQYLSTLSASISADSTVNFAAHNADAAAHAAAFSAYASARPTVDAQKAANQTSITSATFIKITYPTENWDIGSYFASSTWTPPTGKYRISAQITFNTANAVDGESLICALYKNGSAFRFKRVLRAGTDECAADINTLVTANGTDTFEIYGRKSGAGDGTIKGGADETWFTAEAIS